MSLYLLIALLLVIAGTRAYHFGRQRIEGKFIKVLNFFLYFILIILAIEWIHFNFYEKTHRYCVTGFIYLFAIIIFACYIFK